jgi:transcriptional regulator with XRE-family HTH domain
MKANQRMQAIINAIRNRRVALNYSQEYMAAKMGVGQNCYSKIELGYNKLTVERLLRVCELLELPATELLMAS